MSINMSKGLRFILQSGTDTITTLGAQPVSSGAIASSPPIWSVTQFNVFESNDSARVKAIRNKIIPLRKNRSTEYGATWQIINGEIAIGAIGYCETDTDADLVIEAVFECYGNPDSATYKVEVLDGANMLLGSSEEVLVSTSGDVYKFAVPSFKMAKGFFQSELRFRWRYRVRSAFGSGITQTMAVPFYNFPLRPQLPWVWDSKSDNNPWTDALDLLWEKGRSEFAKMKEVCEQAEIAEVVTKIVNSKVGLVYEDRLGASQFGIDAFDVSDFLSVVIDEKQKVSNRANDVGFLVNCTDCASAVTTFSNLFGGSLYNVKFGTISPAETQSEGRTIFIKFRCNEVRTLGASKCEAPFKRPMSNGGFGYHEVSMFGEYAHTSSIYDACLEVNENVINIPNVRKPRLPTNLRFSSSSSYLKRITQNDIQYYIEWLVYNRTNHLNTATLYANVGVRNIK